MPAEPPVVSARTLAEALDLLAATDGLRPVAGGTDLMVQITGELAPPPERVLDIWHLDELRGISVSDGALTLGALTTYTEMRHSALIQQHLPALVECAATIGAAQIQNRGTIGGNVINASPAGDTLPILLATDAELILTCAAGGERSVPASQFWPAYRTTARRPDELLVRIRIPLPPGREVRFRKVGTRRAQAISKVVMALAWREDGGVWRDVRLAVGSVAPTPIRAHETERVLEGAAPRETTADHAAQTLADEIHPIDDVRSTADYRRVVTARILHRLLREAGGW
ncbi:MAG TPA: xanthine dehydrogenase family protein subunit M [Candidatus Limnocylindrales bacterium]